MRLVCSMLAAAVALLGYSRYLPAQQEKEKWLPIYELSAKVDVAIDPKRLKHGPAAVVAPNGDWLVAFQDSVDHAGNDGVISQVRSTDQGKTWKRDGIVYDGRKEKFFGRNPAYGTTQDGRVVLVVQRWQPLPVGVKFQLGREGIQGSVYLMSQNSGKSYRDLGLVDPEVPLRHQGSTSSILRVGKKLYMVAVSLNAPPSGITLYTSEDPERGWQFAGWVFRADQMPVKYFSYPSIILRSDKALLAQCVLYSRNFQSISKDGGKTWSPPRELSDLKIRNNPDLIYAGNTLVAFGRGPDGCSTQVWFSPDEGETWGYPIVLDHHCYRGGGGYSGALRTSSGDLFIAFSTDAGPRTGIDGGKPDIRGVLLSSVKIRRPLKE